MERNNTEDSTLGLYIQKKGNSSSLCFKKPLNNKTQTSRFILRESFKNQKSPFRTIGSPDINTNQKISKNDHSKNKKRNIASSDEKYGKKTSKSKLYENEMSTPFFKKYLSKMYEDELVDTIKNYPILYNKEKSYYHTARGNSFDDQQLELIIEKNNIESKARTIEPNENDNIINLDNFETFRQRNSKKDEVKRNIFKDLKTTEKKLSKKTKLRKLNTYKDNLPMTTTFNKTLNDNFYNNTSSEAPVKNLAKKEDIKKYKTNRELLKKIDNKIKGINKLKAQLNDNNQAIVNKPLEKNYIKEELKDTLNKNFSSNPNINTRNSKIKGQLKTSESLKDNNYICILCNKKIKNLLYCPKCKKGFCETCLKNKKKKSKFCSFCNYFINDIANYINIAAPEKKTIPYKNSNKLVKFKTSNSKNFKTINVEKNYEVNIGYNNNISKEKDKNEKNKLLINKNECKSSIGKSNKKIIKNNITNEESKEIKVNLKALNLFKNNYNYRTINVNNSTFSKEKYAVTSNNEEEKLNMNTLNTFNPNTYEEDDVEINNNNIQKEKISFVKRLNKKSYDNEIKQTNETKQNKENKINNEDIRKEELKVKEDIIVSSNTNNCNNEIINYCNEHSKEKLICYCVQCNKEFCKKCIENKENNHLEEHKIIEYLSKDSNLKYDNIKNIINTRNEIDKENDFLEKYINYFNNIIKNFEKEKEMNLEYINNIINNYINDIENKIEEIKTIINKIKIKQSIISDDKNSIQKYFDFYPNDSSNDNICKEYNEQYQEIINNIKNNNLFGNLNINYTSEKIKWDNNNNNLFFNIFSSQIINYNKNIFNENKTLLVNSKLIFDNDYLENLNDIIKKTSIKNDNPLNGMLIYENENNCNAIYVVSKGDKAMIQISIKLIQTKNKLKEELIVNKKNIFGNVLLSYGEKVVVFELKEKIIYNGMLYLYDLVPWEQLVNNDHYKDNDNNKLDNEISFKVTLCIFKN